MHPAPRAFRSKSFRIFYAGQGLSLLGNWMQAVAMSWLVYRVTGSALLLGVTAGAQQLAGGAFALGLKSWARAVRPVYLRQGIIRNRGCRLRSGRPIEPKTGHFFFMKKVKTLSASSCESS